MTLASDLLEQAQHLAALEQGRPRQASLRRAVSAAYYSLFHLVVDEAARYLVTAAKLRPAVARTFEHSAVKSAAEAVGAVARRPQNNHWFRPYLNDPISPDLVAVCDTFVDLQEQRHRADYDTSVAFTRGQTNGIVSVTLVAHTLWRRERNTHNARAFMLACAKLLRSR